MSADPLHPIETKIGSLDLRPLVARLRTDDGEEIEMDLPLFGIPCDRMCMHMRLLRGPTEVSLHLSIANEKAVDPFLNSFQVGDFKCSAIAWQGIPDMLQVLRLPSDLRAPYTGREVRSLPIEAQGVGYQFGLCIVVRARGA